MKKYELLAALFESELDAFIICRKRQIGVNVGNGDNSTDVDFGKNISALGYNLESSPYLLERKLVMDTLQRIEGYVPNSLNYFHSGVERALDERESDLRSSCSPDSGPIHG